MANYTMLTIRIPAEVEKLLNALAAAQKATSAASIALENLDKNSQKMMDERMEEGESDKEAEEWWTSERNAKRIEYEQAHFAMHVAADNLATWWNAVNLPF
jgi:uncharacterized iron-regulated protein